MVLYELSLWCALNIKNEFHLKFVLEGLMRPQLFQNKYWLIYSIMWNRHFCTCCQMSHSHFRSDDGIHHFSGWLRFKSFPQDFDFQKVFLRFKSSVNQHHFLDQAECADLLLLFLGTPSPQRPPERVPPRAAPWKGLLAPHHLGCSLHEGWEATWKLPLLFFHLCWEFSLEKWHSEKEVQTMREPVQRFGHVRPSRPWQPWRRPSREWQSQGPPAKADGSRPKRSWWGWSHTSVH